MDRRVILGAVLVLVVVVGGIFLLIGLTQSETNTGSLSYLPSGGMTATA